MTSTTRARTVALLAAFALANGAPAALADDAAGTAATSTATVTPLVTTSPAATDSPTEPVGATGTTAGPVAVTTEPVTQPSASPTPAPTTPAPGYAPAAAEAVSIVAPGSTTFTVKDVQIRLRLRDYWPWGIDGYYGSTLTAALKKFQGDQGLAVTGVLTQETFDRIVARTRTDLVVQPGATSFVVKDTQIRLRLLGLWPYGIDGYNGSTLANRILAFQQTYELPYSGVLDERTLGQLLKRTASPVLIASGSSTLTAKDVQIRLRLLGLWPYGIDGYNGSTLANRLLAFQQTYQLPYTGSVDRRTFDALAARTASPAIVTKWTFSTTGKDVQYRLRQLGLWPYGIDGYYGSTLANRLLAFQQVYQLPYTGALDRRTYDALVARTLPMPAPNSFDSARFYAGLPPVLPALSQLDARCRTGRVMCVNKSTRTLTWVVNGVPTKAMWARFGRPGEETNEGTFSVYKKYEYVISNLYFSPMPYSMFYSGGEAVHYSSGFAREGYAGASHGCVNLADYNGIKWLYSQVRIGDKVVVGW